MAVFFRLIILLAVIVWPIKASEQVLLPFSVKPRLHEISNPPVETKRTDYRTLARIVAANHGLIPVFFITLIEIESSFKPYALHLSCPRNRTLGWKLRKMKIQYTWYATSRRHHYVIREITLNQAMKLLRWATRVPGVDFDVGLGQINRRKLKDLKISPINALNPEVNLNLAAQIFKTCLEQTGRRYLAAAECYHRGHFTGKYTAYAKTLARRLKRISSTLN